MLNISRTIKGSFKLLLHHSEANKRRKHKAAVKGLDVLTFTNTLVTVYHHSAPYRES